MGVVKIFPKGPNAPLSLPKPIPQPLRHNAETTLHADLSDARLRAGHEAVQLNTDAFHRGNDIFVAPGVQPFTDVGEQLVYHELGHIWEAQISPIRPFRPDEVPPEFAERAKIAEGLVEVSDSGSSSGGGSAEGSST